MTQDIVECSLCSKPTSEYCSTLACRACHVSITFEDCVGGTTPEEAAWEAAKKAAAPSCSHSRARPVFLDLDPSINRQCEDCDTLFAEDSSSEGK